MSKISVGEQRKIKAGTSCLRFRLNFFLSAIGD